MDWSRCDEIEYDHRFENNNIIQTGNVWWEKHAARKNSFEMRDIFQIGNRLKPFSVLRTGDEKKSSSFFFCDHKKSASAKH